MVVYHEQALTSQGFPVDAGLLPLIEALWAKGFETRFSCEGTHPNDLYAYITFFCEERANEDALWELVKELVPNERERGVLSMVLGPQGGLISRERASRRWLLRWETWDEREHIVTVRFKPKLTSSFLHAVEKLSLRGATDRTSVNYSG